MILKIDDVCGPLKQICGTVNASLKALELPHSALYSETLQR